MIALLVKLPRAPLRAYPMPDLGTAQEQARAAMRWGATAAIVVRGRGRTIARVGGTMQA